MAGDKIKIDRSVAGLRDMLFDELEKFRAGDSSTKRAQTVINFAREIVQATRLEIVSSALLLEKMRGQAGSSSKTLSLK